MREEEIEVEVDAVVLATGFKLFPADAKPRVRLRQVQERHHRHADGPPARPDAAVQRACVRPGDGKVPDSIAYIMCTGSRDATGRQPALLAHLLHVLRQAEPADHGRPAARRRHRPLHGRARGGQGLRRVLQAGQGHGRHFIKGRVAKITEKDDGNLVVRYEDIEGDGGIVEAEYDMVVLAVGVQPNTEVAGLFEDGALGLDDYFYVGEADEDLDPGRTNLPGVFVAGSASGVKDIPDSILHAGAAVAQAAAHLEKARRRRTPPSPKRRRWR